MTRRYLVVGNPTARSGEARAHLSRALEGLARRGARGELVATEPGGRTIALVREAIDRLAPDAVIAMGGDGTFNEVAQAILGSEVRPPLGMLPMGTANDQARSLGVRPGPRAIEENLDLVLAGHVRRIDAGECAMLDEAGHGVARTMFFDSIGWGLQPEILAKRNEDRARVERIPILRAIYRGQAVFVGATIERFLASMRRPVEFDATIVADGRTVEYRGLTDLIIGGTAIHAGEWVLDRFSEPDDGLFELVPMQGGLDWWSKAVRDYAKLPLFQEDLTAIGIRHSEGFSASRFELSFSRRAAVPTQVDGDLWVSGTRFRVEVHARALPVITPERFDPPWRFSRTGPRRRSDVHA
ncbi:MAG TPA: diacylglycerol kinase family protein [Sandaracinaceae bacterium]